MSGHLAMAQTGTRVHLTDWDRRTLLLAIFAEFEREILRERTRAGLAQARLNGK
jgi:Resolvase, N terminal domain